MSDSNVQLYRHSVKSLKARSSGLERWEATYYVDGEPRYKTLFAKNGLNAVMQFEKEFGKRFATFNKVGV